MGLGYRIFIRPFLKFQDSEKAHKRSLFLLKIFSSNFIFRKILSLLYRPKNLPVSVFGHQFPHPFGLAAGMDKKAEAINGWQSIGLGFIEIGGITFHEQKGNPKPRMFRSDGSRALINRMGFNNPGAVKTQSFLKNYYQRKGRPNVPVWVNLGKSKITENKDAHEDYSKTLDILWDLADIFVINVSSPNTPNLRELQNQEQLRTILNACMETNRIKAAKLNEKEKPILVKIAPDISDEQLHGIIAAAMECGCSGIVATNTTVSRPDTNSTKDAKLFTENGGLSGAPLKDNSTEFIRKIHKITKGKWPIVGVGGIMSADDAWEKISAGATLLQAYSGFVFEGPSLVKTVVKGLQHELHSRGLDNLSDAVGIEHK